jgi:hypothetical protein
MTQCEAKLNSITRRTIGGVPFRLEGDERVRAAGQFTSNFVTGRLGTMPFRASSAIEVSALVETFYQPVWLEEYSIAGGSLQVGTYFNGQDEQAKLFPGTIGVWSNGRVALGATTANRSIGWVRDFFAEAAPAEREDSATLTNSALRYNPKVELLLTLSKLGLMEINPSRKRPSQRGHRVRVGEMYRTENAGGQGLFLITDAGLSAQLLHLEVSADEAADFVERLTAFDQAA